MLNFPSLETIFGQYKIHMASEAATLRHLIPKDRESMVYTSNELFYETIFKLIEVSDLINLIKATLLEKTLIFVGKEEIISQLILGLNQLIHPFKWCFSLIPILPVDLIEMLDAPVPLIIGITPQEYSLIMNEEILSTSEIASKVMIHVDRLENGQLELQIYNLESILDANCISNQEGLISSKSTCSFGGLEELIKKQVSTRDKIQSIHSTLEDFLMPHEVLLEIINVQPTNPQSNRYNSMLQKAEEIYKSHYLLSPDFLTGDKEFINQFTNS